MDSMMDQWRDGLLSDTEILLKLAIEQAEAQAAMQEVICEMSRREHMEFERLAPAWIK